MSSPATLDVALPLISTLLVSGVLIGYALRFRARPEPHFARLDTVQPSYLLTRRVMQSGYFLVSALAKRLGRAGIRANSVTWAGLVMTALAALALGLGHFGIGGVLLLFGAACDALDGAVARLERKLGRSGATLDSIIDRWVEALTLAGIALALRDAPVAVALAFAALFGSFMVSYGSARADIAGVALASGHMRRGERAAWLAVGCLFAPLVAAASELAGGDPRLGKLVTVGCLGVVAIGSMASSFLRARTLIGALRERERGSLSPAPDSGGSDLVEARPPATSVADFLEETRP